MAALDFYKLSRSEKKTILKTTGERVGLPAYAIEKDWWVVQTLRVIFQMEVGKHLLFKGGTSLTKAWGLIERFSEDIDLVLNREYLGFDGGLISKTQVRKLRSASFEYITGTFTEELKKAFAAIGIEGLKFGYENLGDGDQDPVSILISYPNVTEHSSYLPPGLKVEIGSRSMKEPASKRSIISIVGEQFVGRPFADTTIVIPCVNPERTYLEKLYLLHEEFQRPVEKIRVNRLSRHLYDIWKISQTEYKDAAMDEGLIRSIISHRERFSAMKGVDYTSLYPPTLNPIPPAAYIQAWEEDYKKMQDSMIHGDSLNFRELIEAVTAATTEFNALDIKVAEDGK